MATEAQARQTFELAREFYKGGDKSNNKSYFGTGRAFDRFFGVSTPKLNIEPGAALSDKQTARNYRMLENLSMDPTAGRSVVGTTPFEFGMTLYVQNDTRGNCGEMAALAVYCAVAGVHVPADEVSMMTSTNTVDGGFFGGGVRSFGHSFAVLGRGPNAARWVVDPWAGVWCSLDNYATELTAQLRDWLNKGKRIAAPMKDGMCWVEPTNDIVTGILTKNARWQEVGANQKG